MHAFATSIAQAFNLDENLVRPIASCDMQQVAKRPLRSGLIILKAESELGYKPASTEAALALLRERLQQAYSSR